MNLTIKQFARKLFRTQKKRDFLLLMMPKYSVCAEIGVHLGDFSERILKIVKPKELHLIDPWKYEESDVYDKSLYGGKSGKNQAHLDDRYEKVSKRFISQIENGRVKLARGFSSKILQNFEDNYFDWIYIDGNHQYDFVKKDLELGINKVKNGGYLTGDDYTEEGWWQGGVKKAVDEFVELGYLNVVKIKSKQFIVKNTKQ